MKMFKRIDWHIAAVVACAILFGLSIMYSCNASAQTMVSATGAWDPPTYGTPVAFYILQHSEDDGPWVTVSATITDTRHTFEISYTGNHRIRCAGIDAEGRQGPYSLPSEYYQPSTSDVGVPGPPGTPYLTKAE